MKYCTDAAAKLVVECNDLHADPIKYAYIVGSIIATFTVSLMLFIFSCMLMISRNKWNDGEDGEDRPLT
jgi:hypothetical protein